MTAKIRCLEVQLGLDGEYPTTTAAGIKTTTGTDMLFKDATFDWVSLSAAIGTVLAANSMVTLAGFLPGVQNQATPVGREDRFVIPAGMGTMTLKGVDITGCEIDPATGTTTVRVDKATRGGATNVTCAVGPTTGSAQGAAGTGTVTAGDTLIVYTSIAGGHQDVRYLIRLVAA